MTIHRHALTFIVAAMVAMPTGSFAQTERGAISGIVTDQTKAAVPGVSIKVINTGTNVAATVISTESGGFNVASLPPGTYRPGGCPAALPNAVCRGGRSRGG